MGGAARPLARAGADRTVWPGLLRAGPTGGVSRRSRTSGGPSCCCPVGRGGRPRPRCATTRPPRVLRGGWRSAAWRWRRRPDWPTSCRIASASRQGTGQLMRTFPAIWPACCTRTSSSAFVSARRGPTASRSWSCSPQTARLLGFAKVGVNALTRELVRAEAAALAALGAARLVRLGYSPAHSSWPMAGPRSPGAGGTVRGGPAQELGRAESGHGGAGGRAGSDAG